MLLVLPSISNKSKVIQSRDNIDGLSLLINKGLFIRNDQDGQLRKTIHHCAMMYCGICDTYIYSVVRNNILPVTVSKCLSSFFSLCRLICLT